MALTFVKQEQQSKTKTKAKVKVEEVATQTHEEMLVDELVGLELRLRAIDTAKITKRMSEIKAELQSIAANTLQPTDDLTITGNLGAVYLSKCSNTTEINNMAGLVTYLDGKVGTDATMKLLKVQLGDLKKVLSEGEIQPFATSGFGSRTCKILPK